ncbi:MAG TPA: hypothetical protein VM008_01850 [Phycisphaerae bacterium]|nr:hypothetical protein [Phycisphaerae bacterium]
MMIGSSRTYAIGMAHYEMGGGWRSLVAICGAYLFVVLAAVGMYYYTDMSTGTRHGMTSVGVSILLIAQSISLVVFGSFRVSGAIRSDLSSHMIESHRLMPVPSWRAITGYLIGPATQTIAFALLNLILIYICAAFTGTDLSRITIGQATLFAFALLVWSAAAVGTFVMRHLVLVLIAAIVPSMCVMYWVYVFLPALSLLTGPIIGQSIFVFGGSSAGYEWIYTASFVCQAVFFSIFFAGACRRYRGTYATTFSVRQAFLLLLAWSGTTIWSMALGDRVRLAGIAGSEGDFHVPQIIISLIAALLISIVPIRTLIVHQRGRRSVVMTAVFLAAVIGTIAVLPMGAMATKGIAKESFTATAWLVGAAVVTLYSLLYFVRRMRPWVMVLVVGLSMGVIWCVPLFLEVIRMIYVSNHSGPEPKFGMIGNFSPVGALIDIWWTEKSYPPMWGIIWQWFVAGVLAVFAIFVRERKAVQPLMVPVAGPVSPVVPPSPPEVVRG